MPTGFLSNLGSALSGGLSSIGTGLSNLGSYAGSEQGGRAIGGLASIGQLYQGIQGQRALQDAANRQFGLQQQQVALANQERARQLAQQGRAQQAFDQGFSGSGLASFDPERRRQFSDAAVTQSPMGV